MASEVKKIYIISERIVNIAELEKILSRQKYVIISLHVELEKETPSIDTLRALASELQALNEKAVLNFVWREGNLRGESILL